jgi:hypothetical protein
LLFGRKRSSPPARRNVSDDWIAVLPREKSQLFDIVVRDWECSYAMMSVALDDALSLRARGELVCACQQVSIAADLLSRLASILIAACDALADRGKHVGNLPVVEPLRSEFFRGDTAQGAASWNGLLHHVLFGGRSRFFHKIKILSGTVEQLGREFDRAAEDISMGMSVQPGEAWKALDSLHYDLNTCLRETEVVLKSFLRALPTDQVSALAGDLTSAMPVRSVRVRQRFSRAPA